MGGSALLLCPCEHLFLSDHEDPLEEDRLQVERFRSKSERLVWQSFENGTSPSRLSFPSKPVLSTTKRFLSKLQSLYSQYRLQRSLRFWRIQSSSPVSWSSSIRSQRLFQRIPRFRS